MRFRWTGVAERRARQVPVAALAVASASATRAQAGRAAFTAAGAVLAERGPGAGEGVLRLSHRLSSSHLAFPR